MSKTGERKGKNRIGMQIIISAGMCLLLCTVLVSATYAWFSVNRQVSTGKVMAKTGQEDLQLLLSGSPEGPFSATEAAITQMNDAKTNFLMPVSTANLNVFSVRLSGEGDAVTRYAVAEEERNYYHGRIYIKPTAPNMQTSGRMALYFDQREGAGGNIVQDAGGVLTTASRLGLRFQTPQGESYIFHLAPGENATGKQVVVNYSEGMGFSEVPDPSVDLSAYAIKETDTGIVLPARPLAILDLEQTYALDIYFYLEGCDPDCTEKISVQQIDLHMAFYGVLVQ